jgi:hypothetical protein
MTNHCSNKLVVKGDPKDMKAFVDTLVDENGKKQFLFATIVPVPEELQNVTTGLVTINGVKYNNWLLHINGEEVGISTQKENDLISKYGAKNKIEYRLLFWGTKWDALDPILNIQDSEVTIHFDTANNPPTAWLNQASKEFPTLTFELYFAECGTDFYGTVIYKNGPILSEIKSGCFVGSYEFNDDHHDNVNLKHLYNLIPNNDFDITHFYNRIPTEFEIFLEEHGLHKGG